LNKNISKIIISILLIFVGLTFLIVFMKLPHYAISHDFKEGKVEYNITWGEIGKIICNTYKDLLKGSLGTNSKGNSVWQDIRPYFGNTVILTFFTTIISIILGFFIGIYEGKKVELRDSTGRVLWKTIFKSLPEPLIIFIIYLIILKAFNFKIIAPGKTTYMSFKDYIVPILSLLIFPTIHIARITMESIINTYDSQYLISAKMKGASNFRILSNHLIKNIIIDVMEEFSSFIVIIFSNLVIVEYIFYYPGLTHKLIESYVNSDMNTVFGIAVIIGLISITYNTVFKVIKNTIDPIKSKSLQLK